MKKCSIKKCNRNFYGVSWCRLHWRRWKKHGDPLHEHKTHNMSLTKIYNRWKGMLQRTRYTKSVSYKNYGGRGIKIEDPRWFKFENFYADMGEPPTEMHTIERIDNNKGYCKTNCKWVTYLEQARNKRPMRNVYGLAGVYKTKDTFYSQITINYKRKYLGSFSTAEEAHKAYLKALKK